MTPQEAGKWADGLLTRTSHPYFLHYSADGELHTCTVFPSPSLADVVVTGFPEDDWDLQGEVCDAFVAAVASDPRDHYLATESDDDAESVGLSVEELQFAVGTEYAPNAVHQFPAELFSRWEREDAMEANHDELVESRRAVVVEFQRLAPRIPALERHGFGPHIRQLSAMLANEVDEFDVPRAEALLASLSAFGPSRF